MNNKTSVNKKPVSQQAEEKELHNGALHLLDIVPDLDCGISFFNGQWVSVDIAA